MTFNPNVPDLPNQVTVDIPKMLTNNQQLDIFMDKDHFKWSTSSTANRARHRQITFPQALGSEPSLSTYEGILYPLEDQNDTSTRTQLYYKNATEVKQITNRFYDPSAGYMMLPLGTTTKPSLIFMWGSVTGTTGPLTVAVDFNTIANYTGAPAFGFPNNLLNLQISIASNTSSSANNIVIDTATPPTAAGFSYRVNTSFNYTLYWFAIGN